MGLSQEQIEVRDRVAKVQALFAKLQAVIDSEAGDLEPVDVWQVVCRLEQSLEQVWGSEARERCVKTAVNWQTQTQSAVPQDAMLYPTLRRAIKTQRALAVSRRK